MQLREPAIHHDDLRRRLVVRPRQAPALTDRNTQRLEVPRRDDVETCLRLLLPGWGWLPLDLQTKEVLALAEWYERRCAHRCDSRQVRDALEQRGVQRSPRPLVRIVASRWAEARREDAAGLESWAHSHEPGDAPREQAS